MRTAYQSHLNELTTSLKDLIHETTRNMEMATQALFEADLSAAEVVISGADKLALTSRTLDTSVFDLLALQAPVASDLRRVVSALHSVNDVRRMTVISLRIADMARTSHPTVAIPENARSLIHSMAELAVEEGGIAEELLGDLDIETANWLGERHPRMRDYHNAVLALIKDPHCTYSPMEASQLTMLAHFYQRFGDHAVEVSQRVIYLVTGTIRPDLDLPTENDD